MQNEKWYQLRLAKYFAEHYEQYGDAIEFFPDPASNQWLFYIPVTGEMVKLSCNDYGEILCVTYDKGVE